MAWVSLCTWDELAEGQGKPVDVDGFKLAVYRTGTDPAGGAATSVIDSTCPHAGANLSEGTVEDGCAVCPWHFWMFDLSDGQLRDQPGIAVTRYPSRVLEFGGKRLVQADLPSA